MAIQSFIQMPAHNKQDNSEGSRLIVGSSLEWLDSWVCGDDHAKGDEGTVWPPAS